MTEIVHVGDLPDTSSLPGTREQTARQHERIWKILPNLLTPQGKSSATKVIRDGKPGKTVFNWI